MTPGDPPPVTKWKRPVLLVAGIALTVCTVLALRFAWERTDGMFFASVSALLNIIALLGVAIAVRGCDAAWRAPRKDAVTTAPGGSAIPRAGAR